MSPAFFFQSGGVNSYLVVLMEYPGESISNPGGWKGYPGAGKINPAGSTTYPVNRKPYPFSEKQLSGWVAKLSGRGKTQSGSHNLPIRADEIVIRLAKRTYCPNPAGWHVYRNK
ncbi:MAG TPA: hypothetical protein VLQ91_03160 [Draconibacterium sp.]|nr:hypothetical protein [Draconibacterium sp.]